MVHNRGWKHIKKGDTFPNKASKINMSINIYLKSYVGVLSYLES